MLPYPTPTRNVMTFALYLDDASKRIGVVWSPREPFCVSGTLMAMTSLKRRLKGACSCRSD
jgi:hypothetical protein